MVSTAFPLAISCVRRVLVPLMMTLEEQLEGLRRLDLLLELPDEVLHHVVAEAALQGTTPVRLVELAVREFLRCKSAARVERENKEPS